MKKLCQFFNRSTNKQRGQSIVEIVLMTPLLLAALAVPLDFGVSLYMANLTQVAVREGARIGAELQKTGGAAPDFNYTSTQATTVKDVVLARMPDYLTGKTVRVKFFEGNAANCVEFIEITATGNYPFFFYQIMRLFGFNVPNSSPISRTTQMRYTYQPYSNNAPCPTASIDIVY